MSKMSRILNILSLGGEVNIGSAIASNDWPAALRLRRKSVQRSPGSSSKWLQYGHALKECGFYEKARAAYLKAENLAESAEIKLQRAHLEKLSGNIEAAYDLYVEAKARWQGESADVQREIDHLAGTVNELRARGIFPNKNELDCAIYLSSVSKPFEESDRGDLNKRIGRADYSYAFALKGFAAALDDLGIDYRVLDGVAKVPDISCISTAKKVIHIGFYPPEKINLLKGAYNVICFAWEFQRLRLASENPSYNAFSDQATMLDLADEVWVPSRYGVESIRDQLNTRVLYMPSPALIEAGFQTKCKPKTNRAIAKVAKSLNAIPWVPLAILPRVQNWLDREMAHESRSIPRILLRRLESEANPVIYIAVLNVFDYRKRIKELLYAFEAFSKRHPNAFLFLKIADDVKKSGGPNSSLLEGQISSPSELVAGLNSKNIWLTWESFTREQLNAFYDIAKFYVCTSLAEGQNLPLIEAMARKCIPVSVRNTAMKDYIGDENSVVVPDRKTQVSIGFSERYKMYGIEVDVPEVRGVYDSLVKSIELSEDSCEQKANAAFCTVSKVFGTEQLSTRLNELLS